MFTPCWVCNEQNNLVDTQWFGRGDVFNRPDGQTWTATEERVEFPEKASLSWKKYVDARRLEISCGEAPYLVSRYDTVTGEFTDNKSSLTFDGWGAVFDARPIDAVIVLTPDLLGNNKRNSGINLLVKALRPEENDEMIGEVLDSIDACIEHRLKIFRTVEDRLKVRNV